jgi:hypothetical protein
MVARGESSACLPVSVPGSAVKAFLPYFRTLSPDPEPGSGRRQAATGRQGGNAKLSSHLSCQRTITWSILLAT